MEKFIIQETHTKEFLKSKKSYDVLDWTQNINNARIYDTKNGAEICIKSIKKIDYINLSLKIIPVTVKIELNE